MTDHLRNLPVQQVAGWYRRLADRIALESVDGNEPLASLFLRHWLDNRDPSSVYHFTAPAHLRSNSYVDATLRYHRAVFLSERQARFTGGRQAWAGVVPRLQGVAGFTRWNMTQPLEMQYESLVEVGSSPMDILAIQTRGTPAERDLLTALRGFQLRSRVLVRGVPEDGPRVRIEFLSWMAQARDRYDWDYSEYFTVPNPDYRSTRKDAVRPTDRMLTVYHSNARRLEVASLAAPYNLLSNEWPVSEEFKRHAIVNAQRQLN